MPNLTNSKLIQSLKTNMGTEEQKKWMAVERETSRMWRYFWIRLAHDRGYTDSEIANDFEMPRSTVRHILRKTS